VTTELDREDWSFQKCETCGSRQAQLTIDSQPNNPHGGKYSVHCWPCYWQSPIWRKGPIVNCGAVWDLVDVRRQLQLP
jgi:hypothetical protein